MENKFHEQYFRLIFVDWSATCLTCVFGRECANRNADITCIRDWLQFGHPLFFWESIWNKQTTRETQGFEPIDTWKYSLTHHARSSEMASVQGIYLSRVLRRTVSA